MLLTGYDELVHIFNPTADSQIRSWAYELFTEFPAYSD